MFFGAAGLLTVVLLAAVAFLVISGGHGAKGEAVTVGRPAATGYSPGAYSSAPSTATFSAIADRSADAAPLTVDEAFPGAAAVLSDPVTHAQLVLRAKELDADCARAVWGAATGTALRAAGCTQAARGLYSDAAGGYAASVTIFNLSDADAAGRFVNGLAATAPGRGGGGAGGFMVAPPAAAPLDRFGSGFSVARGVAMGHFAVVSWAERVDGSGTAQDEGLLSLLVTTGQPQPVIARTAARS